MRSLVLSSVLVSFLVPAPVASADEHDGVPEDPPSQSACVQALRQCGASVHIADDGRVLGVAMPTKATDAHMAALRGLTDVQQLYVPSPKVTDEGLKSVEHLKQLRTLNLNETGVTDAGMTRIARLPRLRSLYLDRTDIEDQGLAHVSRLNELRVLSLRGTRITDSGLQDVRKMNRLAVLNVLDTGVTTDGILRLRLDLPQLDVSSNSAESTSAREKLKQLKATLESEDGCVTSVRIDTQQGVDEGLRLLSGLPGLKRLSLIGVTLTPEHITTLTELEDLNKLEVVVHEKIAHKDYRRLCQAMRGTNIAGWYLKPLSGQSASERTKTVSLRTSSSGVVGPYDYLLGRNVVLRKEQKFQCSYYPGTRDMESIPVILLHEWGGSRRDFEPFARKLQSHGCAVVVPEMWPGVDRRDPPDKASARKTAGSRAFLTHFWTLGWAQLDAIATFLVDEHNKGALNVSLLCIMADGTAGFLATNWTMLWVRDPPINPITNAKAFDIEALACLSPRIPSGHARFLVRLPTEDMSNIPMMLVTGAQHKDRLNAAEEAYASLNRSYNAVRHRSADVDPSRKEPQHPNLSLVKVASRKQGIALVNEHPSVAKQLAEFVEKSVDDDRDECPWRIRTTPNLESAFESE